MSASAEYLLATNLHIADRAARKQGWHAHGRAGWIKPDGNEVVYICFLEQVAAIDRLATIYYVGELPPNVRRFERKWAKLRA